MDYDDVHPKRRYLILDLIKLINMGTFLRDSVFNVMAPAPSHKTEFIVLKEILYISSQSTSP